MKLELTTVGDRKIVIVKSKINGIAESTEDQKEKWGIHSQVWCEGDDEPFVVKETISEINF